MLNIKFTGVKKAEPKLLVKDLHPGAVFRQSGNPDYIYMKTQEGAICLNDSQRPCRAAGERLIFESEAKVLNATLVIKEN